MNICFLTKVRSFPQKVKSFPQKVKLFPQKVKGFSSYQKQFPWKVKSMNIHFLTRSNERKTISLQGQIIFFLPKFNFLQIIFDLTFGGKKISLEGQFDLQRLETTKSYPSEFLNIYPSYLTKLIHTTLNKI